MHLAICGSTKANARLQLSLRWRAVSSGHLDVETGGHCARIFQPLP